MIFLKSLGLYIPLGQGSLKYEGGNKLLEFFVLLCFFSKRLLTLPLDFCLSKSGFFINNFDVLLKPRKSNKVAIKFYLISVLSGHPYS